MRGNEMKHFLFTIALLLCGTEVFAVDMPKLAREKKCTSCHTIDRKSVGPAWLDVAKKYHGQAEANQFLPVKIQNGGFGIWGKVSMPQQHVTYNEASTLAKFILNLDNNVELASR
jgi:cytochrome c